jgi:CysZ protein
MSGAPSVSFSSGVGSVFTAFSILARTPALWPYALVPTLVLAVLEASFLALGWLVARPWLVEQLPDPAGFWGELGVGVATFGLVALVAWLGLLVSLVVAPVVSAPALETIVERVEQTLGVPPRAPLGFVRELLCGLRATLGALVVALPCLLALFLVDLFFPPAAVVTFPIKLLLTALLVALGLFDYPLTLRGVPFGERLRLLRRYPRVVLGFGGTFAVLFWVSCCGVVLLPVGAAAATLVVTEILRAEGRLPPASS